VNVLRVDAAALDESHIGSIVAHDVRTADGSKFVLRKGNPIDREALAALRALGDRELHLLQIGRDELHENEAGARLAAAVAGPGVEYRGPFASEFTFTARERGLLRVDQQALYDVNDLDGITVFTRFDYQPVEAREELAGAKVTPLVVPRATLERVEAICRARPPLRVEPFGTRRVVALVMERVELRARERFRTALELKLAWYGSRLDTLHTAGDAASCAAVLRRVLDSSPDLVVVAGASSLDPLEPLFGALRELDARMLKHGVPVDPGSVLWVATIGRTTFLGLASSEMFSHKTVLELVLPRLFAGEPIRREDLVRLGHGGFLRREMAFRFPAYGSVDIRDGHS
jgi:hypothetical protein